MNLRSVSASVTASLTLATSLLFGSAASAQVSVASIVSTPGGAVISVPEASYVDIYGNIFAANNTGTSVIEIPANGSPVITLATGLVSIRGVAADSAGNVYVAQTSVATILKIPAGGGANTTVGSGLARSFLMTVDANDNLYVTNTNSINVFKITPAGVQSSLGFTGLTAPHGVAVDAAGDVFVTNFSSDTSIKAVTELTAAGTQITLPITGLNGAYGIAVDAAGDLFIVDGVGGRLLEYTSPTATPIVLATGLGSSSQSVSLSPRGEIVYNNSAKVYSLQQNAAYLYGTAVAATSGSTTITYTFTSGKTLGAPIYASNNASAATFKDNGGSTCTSTKVIAAGGTCLLNVAFTPSQVGLATGAVVLQDNTGTALATTLLSGVGDAGLPAFAPGVQSNTLTGLTMPQGVAVDAAGNVYVADTMLATITKTTSAGVSTTLGFTGLSRPTGVVVDGTGAVYVADAGNNAISRLSAAGVQTIVSTNGLSAPTGLALDALNNLYVADSGRARVVRLDALGNQTTVPLTGLASPTWLALDPAGNLYVSDTGKVIRLSAAGAQTMVAASGPKAPAGLSVGANGTVYVADASRANIYVLPPTGPSFTLGTGITTPAGLALANNGSLYLANANAGQLVLVDRTKDIITFPATAQGSTSAASTVSVQNIGNSTLSFSAFAVSTGFAQQTPVASTDCSASTTLTAAAICNASITYSPNGLGTTTGTVSLTDNALNAAAATQTIQLVGTGTHAYAITLALTTPSSGSPVYGQAVTFTAAVSSNSGGSVPTGSVTFALDGGTPGAAVALVNGQATYSPAGLVAGAHTVTATYSGDSAVATSTITITPAVLNINATPQTRPYNAANPTLTYTLTGFAYTDTAAVVSGTPALATTATTTSAPGSYPITVTLGTLSAANYTFNPVLSTLVVTKATSTITFPAPANATYGTSPIPLGASADSSLAIIYTVVSGPATVTNGAGAAVTITGAGTIKIAANQPGDTNYAAAAQVTQSFIVAPATLTVAANNLSKQTGQANPTLTYTISGFVNGDTSSAVTGTPTLSTTATQSSGFGTYPITIAQGSLTATNYSFTLTKGVLSVTGGTAQTITFSALPNATYGSGPVTLLASASSGDPITYTVTGPATLIGSTLTIQGVGSVSVTASQAGDNTYGAATPVSQSFTIQPAVLTVTTTNATRTINTPNPTFAYTTSGFVRSDTASVVSGAPTFSTTAGLNSPTGTYPIVASLGSLAAANYTFTFVSATLTITPATQTITFAPLPNVVYGVAPVMLTATTSSPLPITYTVTGPATLTGSILSITGVGLVSVTASQAGDATYSAAKSVTQTFTVTAAALIVTASNATNAFGQPIPTSFAYTITGLVNGDTTSVISGKPAVSTTATANSPGGSYPITATIGTLAAANYAFVSFVPGTLTISSAAQTITFAALPNIPQATTSVTLSATASSGLPVTFVLISGPATLSGNVLTISGPGIVSVSAIQPGDTNFAAAVPVTQNFSVTGATTTALTLSTTTANQGSSVTLTAKVTSKTAGVIPGGTVTFYAGTTQLLSSATPPVATATLINGTASFSTTTIPAGSVTLTAVYSGDSVSTGSTSPATPILIIAPDFNVSASATNLTVAGGASVTTVITVTPIGAYSQTISLSCGSLPANLVCTFAPPAFNFYPGTTTATQAQSTTLTITASSLSASLITPQKQQSSNPRTRLAGLFLALPALGLLFTRRRRLNLRLLAMLLMMSGELAALSGCGSASSPYPTPGTYNIPVMFNDGSTVTHALALTVTVQ